MNLTPKEILDLLTVKAVLLPIRKGTKYPIMKSWQKTTFENTQKPAYQKDLQSYGNTGIILGNPSQNLVSIDFDDPMVGESFLARNPWHSRTLRTNSKRGFNLWLIMEGSYPEKCIDLKSQADANAPGEWRGGGGILTVFQGFHKSGIRYKLAQKLPPLKMVFDQINWGNLFPKCHINNINDINDSKEGKGTGPINRTKTLIEKEESVKRTREELQKDAKIWKLYLEYIERRFLAEQGQRNRQLVAMTTFLAFNTSDEITTKLVDAFYDLNEDIFDDSKVTHSYEAQEQLRNVKARWLEELPQSDRTLLEGFPERQRQVFRILWNLARIEKQDAPHGSFYLSCHELGRRIGVDKRQAHRILRQLQSEEVIQTITKGERYQSGKKAKATVFRWLRNLPLFDKRETLFT
ncbi:bifunctional DNA primase/polymerase [Akkermansiaceae bacterium]|nr:bifunctional DNA primase/polymerase [Akkermansiaceae bacterium]MDB4660550.1 bifunctional DNA primase/polymerase [bacterium]MDA7656641.1 bifunctional DNA primase/polymerase [Akkermansiaceae bacterium]MDA8974570.1 bifunctional DNA primase/polymerase [Akkermansiaceae bacterium]MDB4359568.1 bifunctional DNA primase/polymerase [Akkermansiaceae bacterium]